MNTPNSQHEALDENERELARIVRALPGGDPPPALDARILRAAQDAVAATPAHRRRPLLAFGSAWGISSAAAAVLALGVGWQLLNPPGRSLPTGDAGSMPVATEAGKEQRTEVDFIQRDLPETPPPPPAEQGIAALPKAILPMPAPAAPAAHKATDHADALAAQEPFMDEHVDMAHQEFAAAETRARHEAAASQETERRDSYSVGLMAGSDSRQQVAGAAAPAPPAPARPIVGEPSAQQLREQSETLDRVEVTGSRVKSDDLSSGSAKPRARSTTSAARDRERVQRAGDDALARQAWIERIRQRLRDGDAAGAHASLLLYLERHPGVEDLPVDLRRLLQK